MNRDLTESERETVEQNLVEYFAFTQHEVAAELGIKPQPDGSWSEADADRIFAEIERTKRPLLESVFTDDEPPASA